MSDQPYQGGPYEGYDPYQQQHPQHQPQHQQHQQPQPHPQHQSHQQQQQAQQAWSAYDQYPAQAGQYEQPGYDPQHTQQWQGQTWETQTHGTMPAAQETAYPQPHDAYQQQPPHDAFQQQPSHDAFQQQSPHDAFQQQDYQQQGYQQPAHQQQQSYGAFPASAPEAGTASAAAPSPAAPAPTPRPRPRPAPTPAPQPYASPVQEPAAEPAAEPASDAGDAGYGPATLAGNARVTDAQRARAEGRSPIIPPGMQPALLTAVLGVLLAVSAPIASWALVVPLVLLQAVMAAGWFRLNGMWPARQGIALAFAGGLAADVAVLAAGREHAPAAILGPLGIWVLLSLVLQLRSHASPDERMYGLMATVVSAALTVLATGYLGAEPHAVSVGASAVAVAVLARALPLPGPASVVVSLLAAAGAGIAVGGTKGAALGAAAAACALIGHRVASYDYPSRFVHFTAGVALPLSAAAPVVWTLGRALG
ncbi:hypothetical protein ACH41H_41575 [Streptomyces sp. NPDC020800]|uniref:hypothetical protein n=1 Tax=Streptomyces sp. NPDC020800 TaxID=3365092 RepID=UPI0037AEE330